MFGKFVFTTSEVHWIDLVSNVGWWMVMFCPTAFEGFLFPSNPQQSDPYVHQSISGLQFTNKAVLAQAMSKLIAGPWRIRADSFIWPCNLVPWDLIPAVPSCMYTVVTACQWSCRKIMFSVMSCLSVILSVYRLVFFAESLPATGSPLQGIGSSLIPVQGPPSLQGPSPVQDPSSVPPPDMLKRIHYVVCTVHKRAVVTRLKSFLVFYCIYTYCKALHFPFYTVTYGRTQHTVADT